MTLRAHGGTVKALLDFSVNLNPLVKEREISKLLLSSVKSAIKYPEERGESLVRAIAEREGIEEEHIVLGNGSIELFYYLPLVLKPKRAFTLEPTFCEYRYICQINNIEPRALLPVEEFLWDLSYVKSLLREGDILFICNPNNPTGTLLSREAILDLAESGAFIVIDEAFMDFSLEDQSLLKSAAAMKNVIVIKSLTKIYAIAGLRIGFLVANREIVNKFREILPLWNVNGLAIEVAKKMIADSTFLDRTKAYVTKERSYLINALSQFERIKIFDGRANFFLIKTDVAKKLHNFALSRGLYLRDNRGFYGLSEEFIRIAVKERRENRALIGLVRDFFREGRYGL